MYFLTVICELFFSVSIFVCKKKKTRYKCVLFAVFNSFAYYFSVCLLLMLCVLMFVRGNVFVYNVFVCVLC